MPLNYIDVEEARQKAGLRMVVIKGFPSPWQECAKGMLHVKGLDWSAICLKTHRAEIIDWLGEASSPILVCNDQPHISSWSSILLLGERLNPDLPLLPADADERATVMGLCHEIAGEEGFGWFRRIQLVQASLKGEGGFPLPVAENLAKVYDCSEDQPIQPAQRVGDILTMLDHRLQSQQQAGSDYLVGQSLTAADIFWTCFSVMLQPPAQEFCDMNPQMRAALETRDDLTWGAYSQRLQDHAQMVYSKHLAYPLEL